MLLLAGNVAMVLIAWLSADFKWAIVRVRSQEKALLRAYES